MKDTKQVIVVRKKYPDGNGGTRKLRTGKLIAQACHASLAFLTRKIGKNTGFCEDVYIRDVEKEWMEDSYAKVCVGVDTEEELMEIYEKACEIIQEVHLITDSGRTEFNGVPTKTCLAIGPDYSFLIDKITGDLKLL